MIAVLLALAIVVLLVPGALRRLFICIGIAASVAMIPFALAIDLIILATSKRDANGP